MASGDILKEEFLKIRSSYAHKTTARAPMLLKQHYISISGISTSKSEQIF
jgi:hypothetical protein